MNDADIASYFEEWVIGQATGPFPPHELILGAAMDEVRDLFRQHGIDLFDDIRPVAYEDFGFVDLWGDERAILARCFEELDPECESVYMQWLLGSADEPAPIVRIAKSDALSHASDMWFFESQDLHLFDASLRRLVFLTKNGCLSVMDRDRYAALCRKYLEIRRNEKGKRG